MRLAHQFRSGFLMRLVVVCALALSGCSSPSTEQDGGLDAFDSDANLDSNVTDGDADENDSEAPCRDVSPSLVCPPCEEGFRASGALCADIDECQEGTHRCITDDECENRPGGFLCGNCPPGYIDTLGDGTVCEDIDECVVDNGGCDPLTTCTNTEGDRHCGDCPEGYMGTGETGCLFCPESTFTARDETRYDPDMVFIVSGASWQDVLHLVPVTTWTGDEEWCRRSDDAAPRSCLYPTLVYHQEGDSIDGDSLIFFLQQYEPSIVVTAGEPPEALSELLLASDGADLDPEQVRSIELEELSSFWSSTSQVVSVDDDYELALLASTYAAAVNAPLVVRGGRFDRAETYCNKHLICIGTSTPEGQTCHERYSLRELRERYIEMTSTDKVLYLNPADLTEHSVSESFQPEMSFGDLSEIYFRNSLAAPFLAAGKEELILSFDDPSFEAVDAFLERELSELDMVPRYLTIIASPEAVAHTRNVIEPADRFYAALFDSHLSVMAVGRLYGLTVTDVSSTIARSLFYRDLYDALHPDAPHVTYSGNIATSQDSYPAFLDENGYLLTCTGWRITGGPAAEAPCTVLANRISDLDLEHATLFLNSSHGGPTGISIGPDEEGGMALSSSMLPVMGVPLIALGACSTADFDNAVPRADFLPTNFLRKGAIGFFGSVSGADADQASRILSEIFINGVSVGEAVRIFTNTTAFMSVQSEEGPYVGYTLIGDPTINIRHQVTTMNGVDVEELGLSFVESESSLEGETYTISGTITDPRRVSVSQTPSSSRWYSYQRIVDLPKNYTLLADSLTLVEFQGLSTNVALAAGGDAREQVTTERSCLDAPSGVVETVTTTEHDLSRLEQCYSWWDDLEMCFYGGTPDIYETLCCLYDVYAIDRGTYNEWWVVFPNGYNYVTDHAPKVLEVSLQFHVE